MISVHVESERGEYLGPFEFAELPARSDLITIPSDSDSSGVRIFEVDEMSHIAAGVPDIAENVKAPTTLLRCTEIH